MSYIVQEFHTSIMNNYQKITVIFILLSFIVLVAVVKYQGHSNNNNVSDIVSPETLRDISSTSSWPTSSPDEQGINSTVLTNMYTYINDNMKKIDSVLIIRNGFLISEKYFNGYTRSSKHEIHSCTKSITSALIGIAIDKSYIDTVDQKVVDFFPGRTFSNLDSRKQNLTLEHLLTMTTGLDWGESTPPPGFGVIGRDYYYMITSDDWVQHVLDKPMLHDPGEVFNYNSGASHVLSAIIQKTTGMETSLFAQEYLFNPLAIDPADVTWPVDPEGIAIGGSSLRMSPQDMAKIGYLYLNNGTWYDKQIVPAEWVEKSTRGHTHLASFEYYGYQWWLETINRNEDINGYHALGYNGQMIFVIPELDLVVVFTAGGHYPVNLLSDYIIPATTNQTKFTYSSESSTNITATAGINCYYSMLLALVVSFVRRKKILRK
ncbi:MAG: serine hydrolase domain-containing protein [Candidatus Hodarchaeales archaeon]|jgi:CubicO group peptidase (beta-lactamase class C family)